MITIRLGVFVPLFAGKFALCGRKRVRAVALRLLDKRAGRAAQEVENLACTGGWTARKPVRCRPSDAGVGDERQHEQCTAAKTVCGSTSACAP